MAAHNGPLALSVEDVALIAAALDHFAHDTGSFLFSTRRGSAAAEEAERVLRRVRALRAKFPGP